MRKLFSNKSMPVLALALLVVLGSALAETGRIPASICGQVTLAELPPFIGEAILTIGDDTFSGNVTIIPLALPEPRDGGVYYSLVMHVFDFGDGDTLTTIGEEFAMPTDEDPAVSTLHGNMEVTEEGTAGIFAGVSGELRVNGKFNSPPGKASFSANGAVSGYDGD